MYNAGCPARRVRWNHAELGLRQKGLSRRRRFFSGALICIILKKLGRVEDDAQVEEGRSFIYLELAKVSSFSAK
ncbi:hypothetical protein PbDSM24746_04540 [Paenibacillus macerans]|uniref:Uncharacterized protein n=1 Tax=Paenibacillus macerans TaxID=44252 RepID=A0A090Y2P9_PAEMA|nr:hypothetical protein DJ90_2796 [Paenibacillus macerans]GBK60450.1 hypothetical protein PbDSM24746_04540 [Paenibacillus macerans]GBK66749.1 hypothetical protein PbJCM17693_04570 [Paenibacillus macerans]GIP08973.1 hypothetical protein J1TS5_11430 [Paenibacillus macerans]